MSWGKGHGDATVECPRAQSRRDRKRTTGTPRPRTLIVSRQVSWLAGHCLRQAFPGSHPVALLDVGSPLTDAGAAPALARLRDRFRTGFPLGSGGSKSPKNLDAQHYGRQPITRQDKYKDIFISLYFMKPPFLAASSMKAIPCRPIFETRTGVCGCKLAPHRCAFQIEGGNRSACGLRGGGRSSER